MNQSELDRSPSDHVITPAHGCSVADTIKADTRGDLLWQELVSYDGLEYGTFPGALAPNDDNAR